MGLRPGYSRAAIRRGGDSLIRYTQCAEEHSPSNATKAEGCHLSTQTILVNLGLQPAAVLRTDDGSCGAVLCADALPAEYSTEAKQLLQAALERLAYRGYEGNRIEVALVGGSDSATWQIQKWRLALGSTALRNREYDLGGEFYRKVRFDPSTGVLKVYREKTDPSAWNPSSAVLRADDGARVFTSGRQGGVVANATRFFRESKVFDALGQLIVPEHINIGPQAPLKIWSSGCSNGAETYSIAMFVHELLARHRARCPLGVFGTDINEEMLSIGRAGIYRVNKDELNKWGKHFTHYGTVTGNEIHFGETIRSFVSFRSFDIKNAPRKQKFRFIVCANVFQYYGNEARETFLRNFVSVLERPGYIYATPVTDDILQRVGLRRHTRYGVLALT